MRPVAITLAVLGAAGLGAFLAAHYSSPNSRESAPAPAYADAGARTPASDGDQNAALADFELDAEKQKAIWDDEHVTFELEFRFGKAFLKALRERNRDLLSVFLRDGFAGQVLPVPGSGVGRSRTHAGIDETEVKAASHPLRDVTRDEFLGGLLEVAGRFERMAGTGLRVLNIEHIGPDEWRARLLITAYGPGPSTRLTEWESTQLVTFHFSDDSELDTQSVIVDWKSESQVLRTSTERPLFVEATESAGLKDLPGLEDNWDLPPEQVLQYRFQMAVADFDRDGWLDLALATKARSWLLRWSPADSEFQDVTEQVGLRKMHVLFGQPIDLAGWFDYDNDGYPDLVLGNRVYHNERGERMRDVTEAAGITFKRQAQGTLVADYDADGRLDLYILYQASTDNEKPRDRKLSWINETFYGEPNTLWRNLGDGRFEDVTAASNAGAGTRHHLAGSWFFYDDDRWPDLYIANDLANSILLRNRGDGTFEDVSQASGASGYATSMGVATGDTDNDGTADIYVANMFSKMGRRIIAHVSPDDYPPGIFEQIRGSCGGNRLYRRSAGRSDFDEFAEEFGVNAVGWAYAPAMTDVDNDGWLDLYATTGFLSFDRTKPDG